MWTLAPSRPGLRRVNVRNRCVEVLQDLNVALDLEVVLELGLRLGCGDVRGLQDANVRNVDVRAGQTGSAAGQRPESLR